MIKTLITLLAMGMPFASLATATPALETKEHKTVYEVTDNWEAKTEDSDNRRGVQCNCVRRNRRIAKLSLNLQLLL